MRLLARAEPMQPPAPVRARKTRSSTATERVNSVAASPSARATCVELPLSAGPAGLTSVAAASPGCSDIRVSFGVQLVTPIQVSRTKTCRNPLLLALPAADFACAADLPDAGLGVTARKATKRPEELTEGKIPSAPTSEPSGSVEMSCVEGVHEVEAVPKQVSRR